MSLFRVFRRKYDKTRVGGGSRIPPWDIIMLDMEAGTRSRPKATLGISDLLHFDILLSALVPVYYPAYSFRLCVGERRG